MSQPLDEKDKPEFDPTLFGHHLIENLDLHPEKVSYEQDQKKAEIIEKFVKYLPDQLEEFIKSTARDEKLAGNDLVFDSEAEKNKYWATQLQGRIFEMMVELEHADKINSNAIEAEDKQRAMLISHELIEIAKHPHDYGLMLKEHQRIPDAVFVKFNTSTGEIDIDSLGEAKSANHLDLRASEQLSPEGSRQTMTKLVSEINKLVGRKGELRPEQRHLAKILELLDGKKLNMPKELKLDVIMSNDMDFPDPTALTLEAATPEDFPTETNKFNKLFEAKNYKMPSILEEVKKGTIQFVKSEFSKNELMKIVNSVLSENSLDLDFPGEVKQRKQKEQVNQDEVANERVRRITEVVINAPDPEKYADWVLAYLEGGSNTNLQREQKNQVAQVSVHREGSKLIAEHSVTGVTAELNDPSQEKAKGSVIAMLPEALNAHLHDWREVLTEMGIESPVLEAKADGNGDIPLKLSKADSAKVRQVIQGILDAREK